MGIYLGSRYETASLARVTDAQGDTNVVVFRGPSPLPPPTSYAYYLVVEGDRLDTIAQRLYRRADLWWAIADANSDVPLPDPLVAGTILRIPSAHDVS